MYVCAHVSVCVFVCVCTAVPVVFDDNEADRNRLSSERSMPPQTRCFIMGILCVCVCVCVCVYVHTVADKRPKIPTRCCFNEINQKARKSKHFVLCDNKMSFCFPAIIVCFLIRDYCSAIFLCA